MFAALAGDDPDAAFGAFDAQVAHRPTKPSQAVER
jgi:hypothetical protein